MPAKRRVARKRKKDMVTPAEYRCLQHGFMFFTPASYYDGRSLWRNESLRTEMRGIWQFLRPQILKEWIRSDPQRSDNGGPGTRPAGWWAFDAPERRRCLNGVHPLDDPERQAKVAERVANTSQTEGDFNSLLRGLPSVFLVPADFTKAYETQYEYLVRLGLLLDGEEELYREQLQRAALREQRKHAIEEMQ